MMSGPRWVTCSTENGRWRRLQTRIRWPSEWSMALLNSKREMRGGGGRENQSSQQIQQPDLPFTGFQGKAATGVSGTVFWVKALPAVMARLFKSFFWLSCPFSKRNARCKAPADALNVVTDYSWLTNRRAGSGPINPARFTPMPLQGDSGAALPVGGGKCAGHETRGLKSRGKAIWQQGLRW